MTDSVQQLLDREAIKQTKARYFRCIDTKQWDVWRTVFTDDCHFESSKEWDNPDDFVRDVSAALIAARTVHHGHMPEITFTSADTARVIWAMHDYVTFPEPRSGSWGIKGYGHYEEEYRRVGDGWKISFLRLTRVREDPILDPPPRPNPDQRTHAPDWLTRDPGIRRARG
jgi:hypothetical protein